MKIQGPGDLKPDVRKIKKRTGGDAGGFASLLGAGEADETASTSMPQSITSTNMLSLQEVAPENEARKRHIKRGTQMLDQLEKLRNGILMGTVSRAELRQLQASLAEKKEEFTDPKLRSLLQEIETRAAVELAKLENNL